MLMYVPIVYGFLPEINVFIFVFVLTCITNDLCSNTAVSMTHSGPVSQQAATVTGQP